MGKLNKRIFFILETGLAFVLTVFFSIKIVSLLYVSPPYPQVENNSIYLKGSVNKRNEKFTNLISFDYRRFLVRFPGWHTQSFSQIVNARSLIVTSYSLDDFSNLLLRMRFPYWQRGGVKISLKIGGKWYVLKDLVELRNKDYSLDNILFLGLGMENVDSRSISEKDFLDEYFKGKRIIVKDNFLRRMRGKVIIKLTLK